MTQKVTYKDAGVDIDKANTLVDFIKKKAKQTGIISNIGGFGGVFPLDTKEMKEPLLISSTDGVGTKLNIAFLMNKHNTIGIDLVAMCVNDVIVQGAKPLFFLDYLAISKLENTIVEEIIEGITSGCKLSESVLIGGETAEMPGLYKKGEYDLAGFSVAIVDKEKIIDGSKIEEGNVILGLASSGVHSNGFSLVRKVCFDILKLNTNDYIEPLKKTLGEELLTPTKIYVKSILSTINKFQINGMAHITGGGLAENINRVVPSDLKVVINKDTWEVLPIFNFLKEKGNIEEKEMLRVFNNGIGMVLVVRESDSKDIIKHLESLNEKAFKIGKIAKKDSKEVFEFV